jgi:hypothetical protein
MGRQANQGAGSFSFPQRSIGYVSKAVHYAAPKGKTMSDAYRENAIDKTEVEKTRIHEQEETKRVRLKEKEETQRKRWDTVMHPDYIIPRVVGAVLIAALSAIALLIYLNKKYPSPKEPDPPAVCVETAEVIGDTSSPRSCWGGGYITTERLYSAYVLVKCHCGTRPNETKEEKK